MNNTIMTFIVLLMLPGYASALSVFQDKKKDFPATERVEVAGKPASMNKQIKAFICEKIGCPDHIQVDQLTTKGLQVASIHLKLNYQF